MVYLHLDKHFIIQSAINKIFKRLVQSIDLLRMFHHIYNKQYTTNAIFYLLSENE